MSAFINEFQFESKIPTFESFQEQRVKKMDDTKFALRSIIYSELTVFEAKIANELKKVIDQALPHALNVSVRFTVEDHRTFRAQLAYIHPGWEQILEIPQNYDDIDDNQMEITAYVFQPLINVLLAKGYNACIERTNPITDGMVVRVTSK